MVGQLLRLVAFRDWLPRAYANAMTCVLPVAAGGTPAPAFHRNEDIRGATALPILMSHIRTTDPRIGEPLNVHKLRIYWAR